MSSENLDLIYLAPGDVLKGRVEPTIWMRMCQAFGESGVCTRLVSVYAYRSENIRRSEVFDHYGIENPAFDLTILPTPLTVDSPLFWYRSMVVASNWLNAFKTLLSRAIKRRKSKLVIYSRSPAAIFPYLKLRALFAKISDVRFIFETHVLPTAKLPIRVVRQTDGVIVSSKKLAGDLCASLEIPNDRVITAYLASNAKPVTLGKEEARRKLNLAIDGNYIVYTGKLLFDEVVEMLEVAERLGRTRPSAVLVLVGGNPEILAKCRSEAGRRKLKNVLFTGFVSPAEVGFYQAAADVLILNLLKNKEIIEYITPSKVFDYLQAARPIVIAEYPILHELLEHEKNALFVPSHSPHLFAAAICKVLDNPGLAASLAEGAAKSSELYSWGGRVRLISGFIKSVSSRTDGTLRENQF